jgi:RNA polymerase subunit RPABC4/transcription elongation factor Spt4
MALVKCGECGSEVSTQARACPKCGKIRQTSVNWAMIAVVAGVAAFVGYRLLVLIVESGGRI